MNLIQYIAQADPEEEIASSKRNPIGNAKRLYNEYGKINKLADDRVTDENKHQYIICLAGKGGKLETTAGWTGGLIKEAVDLAKKSTSSDAKKNYGGIGNIFKDSAKDIANNWKGLQYGLGNKGKCINLLERKLP